MIDEAARTLHLPTTVEPAPRRRQRSWVLRLSAWFALGLVAASWLFVATERNAQFADLFSAETLDHARRFLDHLAGEGEAQPAWRNGERWREAGRLAYDTLAMSVLAIGIASLGMLLTVIPAARPIADNERHWSGWLLFGIIRGGYIFSRAVPELLWAMLIVFVLSPGVLAGAVALGLHNFGIVGKLCAEVVENLDRRPVQAVRATGAGRAQTLLYAVLPSALPAFLTFVLYRWEVIIRTTIVVGFVSAAGLGREFRLRMSFLHYSDVALLLLVYFLLVVGVDLFGAALRRLAR